MLIQLAACWKDNSSLISIHLMLMLIVLWMQSISRHGNFNTSHVNVNPNKSTDKYMRVLISIHLMLMLITHDTERLTKVLGFQYISC